MTLDALADRTGIEEAKLKPLIEGMVKKGLVFIQMGADEPLYRLLPTVVGFSETPFWAGKKTPEAEKLAPIWLKYTRSAFYHEVGGLSDTPMTRVIPMQESIDDKRKVEAYEDIVGKVKETAEALRLSEANTKVRLLRARLRSSAGDHARLIHGLSWTVNEPEVHPSSGRTNRSD